LTDPFQPLFSHGHVLRRRAQRTANIGNPATESGSDACVKSEANLRRHTLVLYTKPRVWKFERPSLIVAQFPTPSEFEEEYTRIRMQGLRR
jgi:hypothetical protein